MTQAKLTYCGGAGFTGLPEVGIYEVRFGINQAKSFNRLTKARGFYDSLDTEREIWWTGHKPHMIEAYLFMILDQPNIEVRY